MKLKLVLVEPEGKINMGFILRLARNFKIDDICVVNPRFDIRDEEVLNFAARGRELVDRVRITKSLDECVSSSELAVCTTAIYDEDSDVLRQSITLPYLVEIANQVDSISVVFGRESVGLTRSELSRCDLVMTVDVDSDYNVLNLSHAVAIVLYELLKPHRRRLVYGELVGKDYINYIVRYCRWVADIIGLNPDEVEVVFKHVLSKAMVTKAEGRVLYRLFKDLYHIIKSKNLASGVEGD